MPTGLAVYSCTCSTSTIRTSTNETIAHTTQRFLCFQQFFVQFANHRLHQIIGCFQGKILILGSYLYPHYSYSIIPFYCSKRFFVKRRTAITTPVVSALLTELYEVVCPAEPLDIGFGIHLSRISFNRICHVLNHSPFITWLSL